MTEQQIKVGQRWLGKMSKREYKVVCVNHKSVCIENEQGVLYTDYLDDFSDSYTLITEWQPEPGDVVACRCGTKWYPRTFIGMTSDGKYECLGFDYDGTDIIAETHEWLHCRPCEPIEAVPMQPARYRSFEIDWDTFKYPITMCGYSCDIGHTIQGYRIYGYGDCPNADAMVSYESYAKQPCNHDGDAVYAYGRYVGGE